MSAPSPPACEISNVTTNTRLQSSGQKIQGLTSSEAKLRLARFGPNEPVLSKRSASAFQLLVLFANPLAIILLAASAISAVLGEVINASIIVVMVLLIEGRKAFGNVMKYLLMEPVPILGTCSAWRQLQCFFRFFLCSPRRSY